MRHRAKNAYCRRKAWIEITRLILAARVSAPFVAPFVLPFTLLLVCETFPVSVSVRPERYACRDLQGTRDTIPASRRSGLLRTTLDYFLVPGGGLEPPHLAAADFESRR